MRERNADSSRWRLAFAAVLALAMGISPFAIFALGALSPMVVLDLELSRTQLGSLATIGFGVAAVGSVFGGRYVDGREPRSVLIALFVIGGTAAAVMGTAPSLLWMGVAAAVGGVGLGIANPVTNKLIAEHIPPGRRGLQTGVKQSGVSMVQAVTGFVLPAVAVLVGWRGAILLGVVLAIVGIATVATVVPPVHAQAGARREVSRGPVDPAVKWMAGYALLIATATPVALVYAPLYAFERLGFSPALAGTTTGVLGISGMIARMAWGYVTERWASPRRALGVIAMISVVAMLVVLASEPFGSWMVMPGLVAFGFSAMAANAVLMMAVISDPGSAGTGRSTGYINVGLFVGRTIGPVGFGILIDATGSYLVGWSTLAVICLLALATTFAWSHLGERTLA